MGCPYSRDTSSTGRCGDDGISPHPAGANVSALGIDFGCYGFVVSENASGPLAFTAEQRRLIKETWAKMSSQSTAIGKQV